MLKRSLTGLLCSAAAAAVMLTSQLPAYATTADDVAAVARSYGYSEEDIQAGYNEYYSHPEGYPSERLDKAISKLHEAGSQIITTGPQVPNTIQQSLLLHPLSPRTIIPIQLRAEA